MNKAKVRLPTPFEVGQCLEATEYPTVRWLYSLLLFPQAKVDDASRELLKIFGGRRSFCHDPRDNCGDVRSTVNGRTLNLH